LDKNLERMKNQWNLPTTIEIIFTQFNDGVVFETMGGDAPTRPSIICITYNIVAAIGLFDATTHEWGAKARADKTWAVFQTHFKAADSDNKLVETSGTAGYHGAASLSTTLVTTHATLTAS
jgi:hypothetical protein